MPSLKALRNRIRTVVNTQQITKAMKAVSVSKLRRVQASMESTRRYADALARITGHLLQGTPDIEHPFRRVAETPDRVIVVLMTADRGMCGAYNNHAITKADKLIEELGRSRVDLVCVGKKGRDFFRKTNVNIVASHIDLGGSVNAPLLAKVTDDVVERFTSGQADKVMLVYNSFVNMMRYTPTVTEFLPLEPSELLRDDAEEKHEGSGDMIFEPDVETVFGVTLERYLRIRMVTCQADALTAEHSARMIAMSNATDNCEELNQTLTIQMNKARQAMITKELLEIVSGAEALKG
ncbi:MAG: ATP synthase F1 subunit gamma [bacterium]